MSVLNLFNFLKATINQEPAVGDIKYYNENSIFNQNTLTCGSNITCGSSLTLGEAAICGDTYIIKNPLDRNPKLPNLFVTGSIFGYRNLLVSNVSVFNNTVIANRNIIANGRIILSGCGDVASRINRADTLPSSDKNLKKNIEPIENALNKVLQLNGVEFDFIEGADLGHLKTHQIGLIAQDVEKVIPEVVGTNQNGYKGVAYDKLVGVLIEAVKEQQKQIEELKSEIKLLKEDKTNE